MGGGVKERSSQIRCITNFSVSTPSGDEAKAVLYEYTAYFGTYAVEAQAKIVTHQRNGNVNSGWEKKADIQRAYVFAGPDRVILYPVGNENKLIWERMKQE